MTTTVFDRLEGMSVGWTKAEAEVHGTKVWEHTVPMGKEAWAQMVDQTEGFYKLVIARDTGRIMGIHAVGVDASGLSAVAHVVVRLKLTAQQLGQMTFPHPTQFDVIDLAARSV